MVYQFSRRSRGRIASAFFAAALGLGTAEVSAADRLKPAQTPFGISLAPSLDAIGWSAPRFGLSLIGQQPSASRERYARFSIHPRVDVANVFETRFSASVVAEAAPSRLDDTAIATRQAPKAPVLAAVQPDGAGPVVDEAAPAPVVLAYADPSPGAASDAFAALSLPTPDVADPMTDIQVELPSAVPLPVIRPARKAGQPAAVEQPGEPDDAAEQQSEEKPTLARPEKPVEARVAALPPSTKKDKSGFSLRNLFGGTTRAGNGVAVYDISAARVYMPDGSVLEAHSGIGEMADDPRYAHVKMNGPTPPHTYVLKMRERRFHGVEAIRMLPVDGRNKHGRDGFLTHSYLLRGRTAQSHGCVAFKDYPKFLNAFKSGKVTRMVVVPSGGRAVARASRNDSDT